MKSHIFFLLLAFYLPTCSFAAEGKEYNPFPNANCLEGAKVNFFGDIFVNPHHTKGAPYYLKKTKHVLDWADFNVANLEGVITESKTRYFDKERFPFALRLDKNLITALKNARIHYFTRSNNHSVDFGPEEMHKTSQILQAENLFFSGVGEKSRDAFQPIVLTKQDMKIAIYSFTTTYPKEAWAQKNSPGVAAPTIGELKEILTQGKKQFDFIVVSYHWGRELSPQVGDNQINLAQVALNYGADFVYGHHAHVAQNIAIKKVEGKEKQIAYGLGNYIFTSYSEKPGIGLAVNAQFCRETNDKGEKKNSVEIAYVPLNINVRQTNFATTPLKMKNFMEVGKEYFKGKIFASDARFYFPEENKVTTVGQLVSSLESNPVAEGEISVALRHKER